MNWGEVAKKIASFAPAAAALLGGPAAGVIAGQISGALLGHDQGTQAEILTALGNPDAAVKLAEIEAHAKIELKRLDNEREALAVANAGQVNTTMGAEAASQHWPTYSWRPAIGFAVAFNVGFTSIVVGIAYMMVIWGLQGTEAEMDAQTDALQHIPAMIGAMAALIGVVSPILGIASWFRGKAQADPTIPTDNRG